MSNKSSYCDSCLVVAVGLLWKCDLDTVGFQHAPRHIAAFLQTSYIQNQRQDYFIFPSLEPVNSETTFLAPCQSCHLFSVIFLMFLPSTASLSCSLAVSFPVPFLCLFSLSSHLLCCLCLSVLHHSYSLSVQLMYTALGEYGQSSVLNITLNSSATHEPRQAAPLTRRSIDPGVRHFAYSRRRLSSKHGIYKKSERVRRY